MTPVSGPSTGWQEFTLPPYDEIVQVFAGGKRFEAVYRHNASMNDDGEDCDQWQAVHDGKHPRCWSGGACWDSNENGDASWPVEKWRRLPS